MAQVTFTLSPLSKNQWKSVGKVFLWVAVSVGCAIGLDLLFKNHDLLASAPLINVFAVTLGKVFQQEQGIALQYLPEPIAQPLQEAEQPLIHQG